MATQAATEQLPHVPTAELDLYDRALSGSRSAAHAEVYLAQPNRVRVFPHTKNRRPSSVLDG